MKEFRYPAGIDLSAAVCGKVLELAIAPMRLVARQHGYALAVHGSLARDIDLVAVPWIESAKDPEALLENLRGAAMGIFGAARLTEWSEKPHGRRAQSIHVHCDGHFFYFDVSVMPRQPAEDAD